MILTSALYDVEIDSASVDHFFAKVFLVLKLFVRSKFREWSMKLHRYPSDLLHTLRYYICHIVKHSYFQSRQLNSIQANRWCKSYALDIGIRSVDNFNKVLLEMTKHAFLSYAFREQKRYMRRHQIKPTSKKLRSFISRLQEFNAYLADFSPDTEGRETAPLPADIIIYTIYHSQMEKQDDCTRFQLCRFYHQRNDWFL